MEERAPRDSYVDFLRAASLIVVVLWHWAFTILTWVDNGPDAGPHATSPLGFTHGFWLATWLFQVMPLFFYVGGFVHLRSWERARRRGDTLGHFVYQRIRRLAIPAAVVLMAWIAVGTVLGAYFHLVGIGRAVTLIVSPLWFLAVYLMLVLLLPASIRLHERFGSLMLVWLGGLAMMVDVVRFNLGYEQAGWLNMVLVWGLAHQAGFFYQQVVDAPRRTDWALLWAGLFGLVGLVGSGLYPGSMVGVPGERFSNMAPPTFVIVALLIFQMGVVELLRPTMIRVLQRPRWRRANDLINRFSLPLYLVHTTGLAIFLFLAWLLFGYEFTDHTDRSDIDLQWWVTRPLAVVGPLICTLPVIVLFSKIGVRREHRVPADEPEPVAST
ncbi:acyltransferase family protein [Hamadaea tsunoensis]|uniref:acyltransferase family protein n=1 Tax=Hamadaea tsunoensis TaxID=53368 RepID=UPI0004147883|nr:acyltransferase [Hamadaea tsunoensis]